MVVVNVRPPTVVNHESGFYRSIKGHFAEEDEEKAANIRFCKKTSFDLMAHDAR